MRRLLLAALVPLLALAGTVTRTVRFDARELRFERANGFDVVELADLISNTAPGEPMLPVAVYNVAIPPTATVTEVRVTPLDPLELSGTYTLHPVQLPRPLSSPTAPRFVGPNPDVYARTEPYPSEMSGWVHTGTKSEFRIAGFALRPLSWVPATGKLTLYRQMKVEVVYEEGTYSPRPMTLGQQALFSRDVAALVLNPEDVTAFAPPVRLTDNPDVDYCVITTNAQSAWFANLIDWRMKKGWNTQVFTTEWINTNYTGRDLQEKVRNFIIDYYANHGLKFVLLAGDHAQIPSRRCRAIVNTETGNIPADVYYADLQWSYDGNGNSIFGEAAGDTVDMYYDVYLGRASVDNQTQANAFIAKTLFYEKTPTTDYLKKMLLPYVMLFGSSNYSGKVVSDSIAAQTPGDWTDQYIANPTSTTPMRDAINAGYHFCHAAAHGNASGFYTEGGTAIYNTSTASGQTNSTRPIIINSMACISGDFETSDCLAEAMMNNAGGGAVAAMMNSRYGWGTPPSMGPSEKLSNRFYTCFFSDDDADVGGLHARSKEAYVAAAMSQEVWRWCYWALNLFGDPNLTTWQDVPTAMTASHASTVQTGAQSFDVTVTASGSPVPNALVSCYKAGEVQARGRTNASGQVSVIINPLTTGTMYVTVTGSRHLPVENTVTVTQGSPRPFVVYFSQFVDDGDNNRLDPGETANLFVTVENIGDAQATNTLGKLRTASSHITLVDSTSSYGAIPAGDTARGDFYRVTASPSTPPGSRIPFTVNVSSSEGTWNPSFELIIGAPIQPGALCLTHDTGYCKLSVTCLGSIGYTEPVTDAGSGFSYPKTSGSALFYGSLALGNSATYVADRYFSQPASGAVNNDLRLADSLRPILPPAAGDQHFRGSYTDAGHPSPQQLKVTQNSYQVASSGYDDFVVITFDVKNEGASSVAGLYAGVFADFDVGSTPTANICTTDASRRLIFMRMASSANPTVGVKILAPTSAANLSAVDHARYVYPDSAMTDGMKWRFLNGTVTLPNSNRNYDWSIVASVGPFDLNAGQAQRFAVAFVGGTSNALVRAHADSAQSWYDGNVGAKEDPRPRVRDEVGILCRPNPFTRNVHVRLNLPVTGRARIQVFDVSGRVVATLLDEVRPAGGVETDWSPRGLPGGIYLLKADLPDGSRTEKLMHLR